MLISFLQHFVNKMSHQRKIWEGKIPLCICAASHELNNSDDKPMPLFLMVSRVSYLPLINKQVAKYFEKYTDTSGLFVFIFVWFSLLKFKYFFLLFCVVCFS